MKLSIALDSFYDSMAGVLSPKTLTWYTSRLPSMLEALGDMEIETITLQDLRKWRRKLYERDHRYGNGNCNHPEIAGGLSPWTLHQYIRGSKRFFHWCVDEGILQVSPAVRLELPQLPSQ